MSVVSYYGKIKFGLATVIMMPFLLLADYGLKQGLGDKPDSILINEVPSTSGNPLGVNDDGQRFFDPFFLARINWHLNPAGLPGQRLSLPLNVSSKNAR